MVCCVLKSLRTEVPSTNAVANQISSSWWALDHKCLTLIQEGFSDGDPPMVDPVSICFTEVAKKKGRKWKAIIDTSILINLVYIIYLQHIIYTSLLRHMVKIIIMKGTRGCLHTTMRKDRIWLNAKL